VKVHPVLLFVADVEREINVQTHRRILPHGSLVAGDPAGVGQLRGCDVFSQLIPGFDFDRPHNLRRHGIGIL
jgi:hypothetical protein